MRAFVGLGANLGDPVAQVRAAIAALGRLPGTTILAASHLYRTAPIGCVNQPEFVNAVVALDTELGAAALHAELRRIETAHGRARSFPNAPRTLDLDLLLYGSETIATAALTVPHPRMHERAFVLSPITEIAPDVVIPGHGRAADLLARLPDQGVRRDETA